jgi:hypothetical protein
VVLQVEVSDSKEKGVSKEIILKETRRKCPGCGILESPMWDSADFM